jgi:hypothetical protein
MLPLPIMPSPVADSLYLSPGRWRIVLLPEAEAELDNIWDYVAKESGSTEIADRLIDSIAERFYLMAWHPPSDADEMRTCALGCVGSRGRVRHHLPTQRGGRADSPRSPGQPEHRSAIAVVNGRRVLHPIERRSAMDLLKRFFV